MSTAPITVPRDFCIVDAYGQVVMRGQTLDLPTKTGCTTLAEKAPENCFRLGNGWVPIPLQADPKQVFDWATKTWVFPLVSAVVKPLIPSNIRL